MRTKLQRQSLIVICVVLAIAIGYPICAFFPQMRAISAVRQEIRQKQDFIAQTEKMRTVAQEQEKSFEAVHVYINERRAQLTPPRKLSSMYSTINTLAKESEAKPSKFEPQLPVDFESFRKVPLKCEFLGSTRAMQELIERLERIPAAIWIEGLALQAGREPGQPVKCALDLAIFVDNPEISD
jgi:Tfp pilus assembly protein PilO